MWTSLEPASVALEPGSTGSVTLRLRNDGDQVEEYRLSVVGAPADWVRVEPESLRLFPGTLGQAQVSLSPPRTSAVPAGSIPYGIQVRSQLNESLFDVAEGRVTVAPFQEVRAELFPLTVRGRRSASPGVTVRNFGNAPVTATVSARDDEDALMFRPHPPVLAVPPGGAATSRLHARARRLRLSRGSERYPFAASATTSRPDDARRGETMELRGTFVQVPLVPRWLLFLLLALVVLAVLAAVSTMGYLALRDTGEPDQAGNGGQPAASAPAGGQQGGQQGGDQDEQANQNQQGAPTVTIVGRRDRGLLTVKAGSGGNTSVVVAAEPRSGAGRDQQWSVVDAGGGRVVLVSGNPSGAVVLEQRDGSDEVRVRAVAGGAAAVRAGRVADRQRWQLRDAGGGTMVIVNDASDDCLSDRGKDQQARAITCRERPDDQQRWTLSTA